MKKFIRDYTYLLAVGGLIIALDQGTKTLVRTNLSFTDRWSFWPWLEPYAAIVHWKNTGAAFGMLQNFGDVFMVLSIIVTIAILYYFPQVPRQDWTLRLAMGMQMGGAVGNLIDRLTQGYVTDFISLLSRWNLPVFNVADASISIGVVVLLLGVWLKERDLKRATVDSALQVSAESASAESIDTQREMPVTTRVLPGANDASASGAEEIQDG